MALVGAFAPTFEPTRIDKDAFARTMDALAVPVSIDVADPLGQGDVVVDLFVREPKSLRPDVLVKDSPLFRALAEARDELSRVAEGKSSDESAIDRLRRTVLRPSWVDAIAAALVAEVPPPPPPPPPAPPAAVAQA